MSTRRSLVAPTLRFRYEAAVGFWPLATYTSGPAAFVVSTVIRQNVFELSSTLKYCQVALVEKPRAVPGINLVTGFVALRKSLRLGSTLSENACACEVAGVLTRM